MIYLKPSSSSNRRPNPRIQPTRAFWALLDVLGILITRTDLSMHSPGAGN
jgi:hypothetical protein